ncbi:MAG: NUDIX domain-containing protein [Candidatus Woesearchaeota archaeon]
MEGVLGVIKKDGKYLMGIESKDTPLKGKWRLLGGKLDVDESPEDALVRELREEAQIEIELNGYLGVVKGECHDIDIHIYTADWVSGELKPKADEISEMGWFCMDEIARMDTDSISRRLFAKLRP